MLTIIAAFVSKMKNTIQAKNLKSTWHARSVETMVS